MNQIQMHKQPPHRGWFQSKRVTWVLIGFLAIGAFYLITEHTAHLWGVLPYLIFLLCPLMMLFMHNQHNHSRDHSEKGKPGDPGIQAQPPKGGWE